MRAVWNYPLDGRMTTHEMPSGSKFVHIDFREGCITLWFEVYTSPSVRKEKRTFVICGTGKELHRNSNHVASIGDGTYFLHVYELNE